MKKLKYILLILLFFPIIANATNKIYSINMDIILDKQGNANITETWDVEGSDGTEWYKAMYDLGNSNLTDFKVTMDDTNLKYKEWDINESLSQKKGYYGINYTNDGIELCFGKYDFKRHIFKVSYKLSNYVFNTNDSQVLYWKLIDKLSNVDFEHFSVKLSSYYEFPKDLEVWGYGYDGYAYVKDGIIEMSDESGMNDSYAVLLVKFPLNTFETSNVDSRFENFDKVDKLAKEGSYKTENNNFLSNILGIVSSILPFIIISTFIVLLFKEKKYGFINNKTIKDAPMFRDIPCGKDIYYANALTKLNEFSGYKETNILGAIILKWIRQDKIRFINKTKGIFNKETSAIDLTLNPNFDNELEKQLFDMMYKASIDGILETKELEKWCKRNYTQFFNLFNKIKNTSINKLREEGHIYKRKNKKECKYSNVMDDVLYEDSKQLYGLKKFLLEFSNIKEKQVLEVKLLDEYIMFAYIFGIAKKIAKQLKDLYPEIVEEYGYNYDTIVFVDNLSYRTVSAASSARSAAESYNAGGGGFSSFGGGGGSFGGGGGGSR